jgi:hypothetical protein
MMGPRPPVFPGAPSTVAGRRLALPQTTLNLNLCRIVCHSEPLSALGTVAVIGNSLPLTGASTVN